MAKDEKPFCETDDGAMAYLVGDVDKMLRHQVAMAKKAEKEQAAVFEQVGMLRKQINIVVAGLRGVHFLKPKLNGRAMDWHVGQQAISRCDDILKELAIARRFKMTEHADFEEVPDDLVEESRHDKEMIAELKATA